MDIFSLQIKTIKEMLDWRVSLDIILITLLIFFLYRTLKTTGTGKIFLGIVIAAVIFIFARLLDLKGIEWIYSNLSPIFLLALVIIFQPEIRKILERAASIRRRETGGEAANMSAVISDAIFGLSAQKRGALIVLPGQDSVKAWTSEGIALDAQLSFPLLTSIFDPNSPGHDGAVVIEKGKVVSFSVRLPLSQTDTLSAEFGTRHHAGMGLSEVTDAFIIVLSEERGTVTIFYEGNKEGVRDKNILAAKILSHWNYIASFRPFNQNNTTRKKTMTQIAISFVMAFLFWSTVVLTQSELREISYTIPIEYMSASKKFTISGEKPSVVKLNLIGSTSDLDLINPMQLRVTVDLSKLSQGDNIIPITQDNIQLPRGVKLFGTEPSSLELNIIEIQEVDAVVKPQLVGSPSKGRKIGSIEITPNKIPVLAPLDYNTKTEIVLLTTPIYLETLKSNTPLQCKLIAPKNIQPVDNDLPDVEVKINFK